MDTYLKYIRNSRHDSKKNTLNGNAKDDGSDNVGESGNERDSRLRNDFLSTYNGDPRQWLRFWSKFKSIREDS